MEQTPRTQLSSHSSQVTKQAFDGEREPTFELVDATENALNERKRREISPTSETEVTGATSKRQRYPVAFEIPEIVRYEPLRVRVPAIFPSIWTVPTEQVTPENAPPTPFVPALFYPEDPVVHPRFENVGEVGHVTDGELIAAVSDILESICHVNNGRIPVPSTVGQARAPYRSSTYPDGSSSIFFSLERPAVRIHHYIERLVKYMQVSSSVFVVALIYLDRVHAADEILALTDLNVHRLITTALVVACKYLEDEVHRNSTVSKIGGIPSMEEMNMLEAEFLRRIDWNCSVTVQCYEMYRSNVFRALKSTPVAYPTSPWSDNCSAVQVGLNDCPSAASPT